MECDVSHHCKGETRSLNLKPYILCCATRRSGAKTLTSYTVKLHPVLVLFALLCGASLGGILGMFLAVPVTGALKIVGSFAYDHIGEPE